MAAIRRGKSWMLSIQAPSLHVNDVTARLERCYTGVIHDVMRSMGLRAFILPPELRSNSITALRFPRGHTYRELHDALKARGFVVYEGQGRLAREVFRVANMGHLAEADFDAFLTALGEVLGG